MSRPVIHLEKAADSTERHRGPRVLVDRFWPSNVQRSGGGMALWLQSVAPSDELREWYGHDPERWDAFRERYRDELRKREAELERLERLARQGPVTLVHDGEDAERNHAVVIRQVLEERMGEG